MLWRFFFDNLLWFWDIFATKKQVPIVQKDLHECNRCLLDNHA
jgi:hypothetical protein